MAFPYATLCVQGIKDGTSRSALFSQFEDYGRVNDVTITPNKHMRGQPDSKIALVEFERKEDARKAMQALNGRQVQGKCVMIRFARSAPGVRPPGPLPRHGAPELIPQTAGMAKLINQKFKPADGDSESPRRQHRTTSSPPDGVSAAPQRSQGRPFKEQTAEQR